MSSFNDNLKNIKISEICILFIVLYGLFYILDSFSFSIDKKWIYIVLICYFIFKFRHDFNGFKIEVFSIFSKISPKQLLCIVVLNIFFSYGMLYFANGLAGYFPFLMGSTKAIFPLIFENLFFTIIVASILEEFVFRGVLFNKLCIFVPAVFAILISALLFGLLHSFGGMFSAFVFAVCMGILYVRTENIFVPISAHFLNNLLAESIRLMDSGEILFTNGSVMMIMSILALISAAILFICIFKELTNINKQ